MNDCLTSGNQILCGNSSKPIAEMALKPGDVMPDGTIYVGISPDTTRAFYAAANDLPEPSKMHWEMAQDYAKNYTGHGHSDWRLPTIRELGVLFENQAAIGDFNNGKGLVSRYWSASKRTDLSALHQCFSTGKKADYYIHIAGLSTRCVRGAASTAFRDFWGY